jgi:hypothetical protein
VYALNNIMKYVVASAIAALLVAKGCQATPKVRQRPT